MKISLSRLVNTDPESHQRRWMQQMQKIENMKEMANGRDELNELVPGSVVCQLATGMMMNNQEMAWLK